MFTNLKCVLNLTKDGLHSEDSLELFSDDITKVTLENDFGNSISYECLDNLMVKLSEQSYDEMYESNVVDNVVQHYERVLDINDCHMVKMNGVLYRVFKYGSKAYVHNELTNEMQYICNKIELVSLFKSIDPEYKMYKKYYQEI